MSAITVYSVDIIRAMSRMCAELGLRRDVEPQHLASGAEAGQKLFANLRPGAGRRLAATVRGNSLGDDLAMQSGTGTSSGCSEK
jgi:hypothetical protein